VYLLIVVDKPDRWTLDAFQFILKVQPASTE
jgi:hypothetical protein